MKRILVFAAAGVCVALFGYTIHMIFFGTPVDRLLYFNQKIFYYHVPSAFVLFAAVMISGVASILYLKRREGRYDDIALVAGELAVLFGAINLITGSIWGKAAWGVWWQWDMRLTTTLLLWMVMLGYVLVRRYGGPGSERLAAGLAIFGMVDVPLIYFSVRIWKTLHPKTSVVPELSSTMRSTFWLSVLLFMLLFIVMMVVRVGQARAHRQLRETREYGIDVGFFD